MTGTVQIIATRKVRRVDVGGFVFDLPLDTTDVNAMERAQAVTGLLSFVADFVGGADDSTMLIENLDAHGYRGREKPLSEVFASAASALAKRMAEWKP